MTDYLALALAGFFNGIGVATALWTYEKYIKPKFEKLHTEGHDKYEELQKKYDKLKKALD